MEINRHYQTIIGDRNFDYKGNEGLKMYIENTFDDDPFPNEAKIVIYNLSVESRSLFTQRVPIIFNAGYEGDIKTIFAGQIIDVLDVDEGVDIKTEIRCQDAEQAFFDVFIVETFAPGSDAEFILNQIAIRHGITLGTFNLTLNKVYQNGLTVNGRLLNELRQIIVNDCMSNLVIRNQTLNILPVGEGFDEGFVLNSNTGLLQVLKINDERKQAEYKVKMLLNNGVNVRTILQVESRNLNGLCMVVEGKHTKDHETVVEVVTL